MEENSNSPPFPVPSRLTEAKVLMPVVDNESIDTSIKGLLVVVVVGADWNVMLLNWSIPELTKIKEHPVLIVLFTSIVNEMNVTVSSEEAETVKGLPALARSDSTSNVTDAYEYPIDVGRRVKTEEREMGETSEEYVP